MFDWFGRRKSAAPEKPVSSAQAPSPARDSQRPGPQALAPAGASAAAAAPASAPVHAVSQNPAGSSRAPAAGPPAAASGYAQRWPLLGTDGSVRGFELALGGAAARQESKRSSGEQESGGAASVAHQVALMAAARLAQAEGRQALVSLPAAALGRAAVAQQVERGMWLAASDPWADADVQQALRARGARLGLAFSPQASAGAGSGGAGASAPASSFQNLDFVLLRASPGGLGPMLSAAEQWRRLKPKLPLIATGVADVGEMEQLLRAGFALVGGRLGGRASGGAGTPPAAASKTSPSRLAAKSLEPASVRLFALINHLAQDCNNGVIAEAARKDVALSYRLLRYANSPAVGLRHPVDSIEQALSLLGRNEFRRWLQVMLLTTGSARPASMALQEDALARARLFESLGRERGETATDALFTLGLLSQLDLLLQVPLADALEPLRLPEDTRAALLDRRGAWAAYLALADELEQDDENRLDQAATAFGGAAAVLAQAQSAWGWAARVMASQQTPSGAAAAQQAVPA
jgi:c-di-GMP phosphodiesterase